MNKKGQGEVETILGVLVFVIIIGIFLAQGVFSSIIDAFSKSFGGMGLLLGISLSIMITIAILEAILGK